MDGKNFLLKYKLGLGFFAIIYLIVSFIAYGLEDFFLYRLLRGTICFATLLFLLIVQRKKVRPWLLGFLFFYGASSLATGWYEESTMAAVSMMLNFVSFCFLLAYIVPKFKFKNLNQTFALLFFLTMAINGYLFFQLIGLMKAMTLSQTQYIFMVLGMACGIFLGFLALFNNHYFNTPQSMSFTFLVFLIIFAEIFRGIGYYDLAYSVVFIYLARIFLTLAMFVAVNLSFVLVSKEETELS